MSCVSLDRIGAAASGEDAEAVAHAEACERCRAALAAERDNRALVLRAPEPALDPGRMAELRAHVLASSERAGDMLPMRARRPLRWIAAGVLAAAAAIALALGLRTSSEQRVHVVTPLPPPAPRVEPPPSPPPPVPREPDERITLDTGHVAIDTRGRRGAQIVAPGARITIHDAGAEVTVSSGRRVQVSVFAGSVEIAAGSRTTVVEAGTSWELAPPAPRFVDAFATGWAAFRDGRYREAIAAFDRTTDPAVLEDARFWAAVALAKSGDAVGARRRLRGFLAAFPRSPHADAARAELRD